MFSYLFSSIRGILFFTILSGILYPFTVTEIANIAFPYQAMGSLIRKDGNIIGSELIGQRFSKDEYFWGRPSATSPNPYNGTASSGSNLAVSNPILRDQIATRVEKFISGNKEAQVPVDLVTTSGSGLDPHISIAAALFQVGRVARARKIHEEELRQTVLSLVEGRTFGVIGESRINVLRLNLKIDEIYGPIQ